MICAGIDAGSRAIKIVLIDRDSRDVLTHAVVDQGVQQEALASELLGQALAKAGAARKDLHRPPFYSTITRGKSIPRESITGYCTSCL